MVCENCPWESCCFVYILITFYVEHTFFRQVSKGQVNNIWVRLIAYDSKGKCHLEIGDLITTQNLNVINAIIIMQL